MGSGENILEAIMGIVLVVFFFFMVLPEMAKILGTVDVGWIYFLGFVLIVVLVLSIVKR